MNNFIRILPLIMLLVMSVAADAKSSVKQDKKVDAKCFVELVGGGETVVFSNISRKNLSSLSKSIVGRKVLVANSKEKKEVYKAHECVLSKDDFSSNRAIMVDAKTAR